LPSRRSKTLKVISNLMTYLALHLTPNLLSLNHTTGCLSSFTIHSNKVVLHWSYSFEMRCIARG
jgi:hypothetical protein